MHFHCRLYTGFWQWVETKPTKLYMHDLQRKSEDVAYLLLLENCTSCPALWPEWHAASHTRDESADRHHDHRKCCHRGHIRSKRGIPETFKSSNNEVNESGVHGASEIDKHLLAQTAALSPHTAKQPDEKLEACWADRQPPRWNVEHKPRCGLVVLCPQMISCIAGMKPKKRDSSSNNPSVGDCAGCELLEHH